MASPRSSLPSADERGELVGHVRLVVTRLARQLRQQSEHTLTPTQEATMSAIMRRGPLPLSVLAMHERVAPATVTGAVDKLEKFGFVDRLRDPSDRRVTLVAVSKAGKAAMAEARKRRTAWLETRMADLEPDALRRLANAIDVLEMLIEQEDP